MEARHTGMTDHALSLQPLSFPQSWAWDGQLQASHNLVFLLTRPHPETIREPTKRGLIRVKDTLIVRDISRNLGALCQAPGAETRYTLQSLSQDLGKLLHPVNLRTAVWNV